MKALISVADKTNIVKFAKELSCLNIELISTGGTYKLLSNSGLIVQDVLDITSFNKPIDSIIKTLYPEIYAGISANRNSSIQMNQLQNSNINTIDIVVVNLFPLDPFSKEKDASLDDFLEHIDIGGPTLLRSAAKSYKDIVVVSDPSDYPMVIQELKLSNHISINTRLYLMKKVFETTYKYDLHINKIISSFLIKN